ncbi:hypothetical protein FBULB1_314 [Fusarium bulbicola]|nr:hypothetical protein FBULB1_314 [Fusarium bulbicola]
MTYTTQNTRSAYRSSGISDWVLLSFFMLRWYLVKERRSSSRGAIKGEAKPKTPNLRSKKTKKEAPPKKKKTHKTTPAHRRTLYEEEEEKRRSHLLRFPRRWGGGEEAEEWEREERRRRERRSLAKDQEQYAPP